MQSMDKTSKLFLESEIKRILNLNEKVDSGDFIMETLDNETLSLLSGTKNSIRQFLISKSLLDKDIDDIMNKVILKDFQSGKFCDSRGKVKCAHLAKYLLDNIKKENIDNLTDVSTFYDGIRKMKKTDLKKAVEIHVGIPQPPPKIKFTEEQADSLLNDMIDFKDFIIMFEGWSDQEFNNKVLNIKKQLMDGTYCTKCKDADEVSTKYQNWLDEYITTKVDEIPRADIDDYLAKLKGNKELLKRFGKVDFLSKKIDSLLDRNDKSSVDDDEMKLFDINDLLKLKNKNILITYTPNTILKNDKEMNEFITKSQGNLTGKIINFGESGKLGKYFEFMVYGPGGSGRYVFVIPYDRDGLNYPKPQKIRIKSKNPTTGKWGSLYDYTPDFKIKINTVKGR